MHFHISNEVHGKTDTLFPGNSTTVAELEPLTIRSGGSSSNHYATFILLEIQNEPLLNTNNLHNITSRNRTIVLFNSVVLVNYN